MVDTYHIPQKNAVTTSETATEGTLRQTVQEVLRATVPQIFNYCGDVHVYMTLHIHHGNPIDPPEA
jgi:hypothetical protein